MSLEQNEFRARFSYQEPILPDSLDDATAFFYAASQLIRSTPSQTSGALASNRPGIATWLLDRLGTRVRDIVVTPVGWIRRVGIAAPTTWKR
jgi:hypothetical protein